MITVEVTATDNTRHTEKTHLISVQLIRGKQRGLTIAALVGHLVGPKNACMLAACRVWPCRLAPCLQSLASKKRASNRHDELMHDHDTPNHFQSLVEVDDIIL